MLELQGIAVSPGVAIGQVLILDQEGYRITRGQVPPADLKNETERLRQAIDAAVSRLESHREHSSRTLGKSVGNIFSAHQQLLLDPSLHSELFHLVEDESYSAEYAVSTVFTRYAQAFRRMGSSIMAERAADIRDVERTLLEVLGGHPVEDRTSPTEPGVLASHDLTPGETARLDRNTILGFCTEVGGSGGHTAIVARGLEIPAVVGLGSFLYRLRGGNIIIVDGYRGRVIIQPDEQTIQHYNERREDRRSRAAKLAGNRDLPAVTRDGTEVHLLANIEFPNEVKAGLARGATGVGLYRTEFLYLGSSSEPTEEEHFEAYSSVAEAMGDKPVVIRTLDLGADKMGSRTPAEQEHNPFLGLRSIRLSLRNPALFRTQLRAALRAASYGNLHVMFPMITTLHELRTARMVLRQVADDLREEGLNVPEEIPVGMMVEVPAAVLMLERFLPEVDFISIGTNDLTQYTLAVDRSNEYVADLYTAVDPAVLRLIKMSVDMAQAHGIDVSVCGEMSSTPAYALLLVGMGVRTLSAPPAALPGVKHAIRSVTLEQCKAIASRALEVELAREVDAYLMSHFASLVPELALGV
ncbi:MAG: phosphoenolpyruvate--protein phosphotransferase [Pirellulales bacterium]